MRLFITAIACFFSVTLLSQNISTGLFHCVAINNHGRVVLWGDNSKQQVSTRINLENVISVSAGEYHTLALKDDGTVVAWGLNKDGQCDIPQNLENVTKISSGTNFSLALKEDGSVVAWGANNEDQCDVPKSLTNVISISAGTDHAIALTNKGEIITWGRNNYRKCQVPEVLKSGLKATQVSAGQSHSLALSQNGHVFAWGYNKEFQCQVPEDLENVILISAGTNHSLALKEDGTLVSWGLGGSSEANLGASVLKLGLGGIVGGIAANAILKNRTEENSYNNDNPIIQISASNNFSLVLKENGEVQAFGTNRKGRCDIPEEFLKTEKSETEDISNPISNQNQSKNIRVRVSNSTFSTLTINKVAVIGKESTLCDKSKDDGQSLAELVEGELLGIYGVVERKHLEEILDEQRLAMSGLMLEDTDFAQAGCLAGAQGTVLASYGCLQGKTKLQIKLVDCSTSDLYWSATGFDVSEFELLDALRIELKNKTINESTNITGKSQENIQLDKHKVEIHQEQNVVPQPKNEDPEQNEIVTFSIGDTIEFCLNNDKTKLFVGEIIKVLDNGKLAVSYVDQKGKTKRDYIKVDDIIN